MKLFRLAGFVFRRGVTRSERLLTLFRYHSIKLYVDKDSFLNKVQISVGMPK